MDISPRKAMIVGAGPAGLLLAYYLLNRQYQVELFDRRPDPRSVDLNQQRSFPVALQERGRKALQGISRLEDAIAQFSKERVADAHALVDLSDDSFPRAKWLIPEFLFRLTVGRKLNKWFPQRFSPFVFDLVLDSDMSYSEVLELSRGWINKVKRSTDRLSLQE